MHVKLNVRKAGPALEEASFNTTVTSPPPAPPAIDLRLPFFCSCVLVFVLIVVEVMVLSAQNSCLLLQVVIQAQYHVSVA